MSFSPGLTPIILYFIFGSIDFAKSIIRTEGILGIKISPLHSNERIIIKSTLR